MFATLFTKLSPHYGSKPVDRSVLPPYHDEMVFFLFQHEDGIVQLFKSVIAIFKEKYFYVKSDQDRLVINIVCDVLNRILQIYHVNDKYYHCSKHSEIMNFIQFHMENSDILTFLREINGLVDPEINIAGNYVKYELEQLIKILSVDLDYHCQPTHRVTEFYMKSRL